MSNSGNNLDFLDMLTILSVMLQRQGKAYLEKIIESQNKILEKLADL